MSLETLKNKVEQLIEKAQSGGSSELIEYPDIGYTRPSFWLPRPTLTKGDNVNEVWALIEVLPDVMEYEGVHLSDIAILPNNKKQFWYMVEPELSTDGTYATLGDVPNAIELIVNCIVPLRLTPDTGVSTSQIYTLTARAIYRDVEIITGTPIELHADKIFSQAKKLKLVENDLIVGDVNLRYFFYGCGIVKAPNLVIPPTASITGSAYNIYHYCTQLIDGGEFDGAMAKGMNNAFTSCFLLKRVRIKANVTTGCGSNTFQYCNALEDVYIENGYSSSLYLNYSTRYTQEVLHKIIENYADCTGKTTAPKFKIGGENLAKIDEEHIAMLNEKNISYE